ncbi:MAG: hypothetical protein ABEJ57_01130 [Halobacteriaceae archaeon]
MSTLEACYFCGAVEEVTRQPALPTTVLPPETSARTVALCPDCRQRLETVLAPLTDGTESVPGTVGGDEDQAGPGVGDGDAEETVTADGDDEADPPEAEGADQRPVGYGKVLRFLRNRELPMAEETVVELAITAYDLRREEVQDALDYAVETGVLEASDGEIRRA